MRLVEAVVRITWRDGLYETGYKIERSRSGSWVTAGTAAVNSTQFNDPDLKGNTTYGYRVTAMGLLGDSAPSAVVMITTPSATFGCSTAVAGGPASGTTMAGILVLGMLVVIRQRRCTGQSCIPGKTGKESEGVGDWGNSATDLPG